MWATQPSERRRPAPGRSSLWARNMNTRGLHRTREVVVGTRWSTCRRSSGTPRRRGERRTRIIITTASCSLARRRPDRRRETACVTWSRGTRRSTARRGQPSEFGLFCLFVCLVVVGVVSLVNTHHHHHHHHHHNNNKQPCASCNN